jgi:hypothetical protein
MLEINEGIIGPDPPAKLLSSYSGSGRFQQGGQDLERLCLQLHPDTVLTEFTFFEIDLERPKSNDLTRVIDGIHKYRSR